MHGQLCHSMMKITLPCCKSKYDVITDHERPRSRPVDNKPAWDLWSWSWKKGFVCYDWQYIRWLMWLAVVDGGSLTLRPRTVGWKNNKFHELGRIYQHHVSHSHAHTRSRQNRLKSHHRRDSLGDTADELRQLSVKK